MRSIQFGGKVNYVLKNQPDPTLSPVPPLPVPVSTPKSYSATPKSYSESTPTPSVVPTEESQSRPSVELDPEVGASAQMDSSGFVRQLNSLVLISNIVVMMLMV